jgi:hypothetical protein
VRDSTEASYHKVVLDVRVVQIDTQHSCLGVPQGMIGVAHGHGLHGEQKWKPTPGQLHRQTSFEDDVHAPGHLPAQHGASAHQLAHLAHFPHSTPSFLPPRANSAQIGALPQNRFGEQSAGPALRPMPRHGLEQPRYVYTIFMRWTYRCDCLPHSAPRTTLTANGRRRA